MYSLIKIVGLDQFVNTEKNQKYIKIILMDKDIYLKQLSWIIPIFVANIVIPIVAFLSNNGKKHKLKKDAYFWGFMFSIILGNVFLAYFIGFFAYINVQFESTIQHSFLAIWFVSFFVISTIEGMCYYFVIKNKDKVTITVSMSPNDYKNLILNAEKEAKTIWLMPKRITVMFKSDAMIKAIAKNRFGGEGSAYYQSYVIEHIERKNSFYTSLLNKGLVVYELHSEDELIEYVKSKSHIGADGIDKKHFIDMINEWKRFMIEYPSNYYVRLTRKKIPIKYEIIDDKKLIIHESVGDESRGRLNAIMVESKSVVGKIRNDFSNLWEHTPSDKRQNEDVIKFIDDVLLPILTKEY